MSRWLSRLVDLRPGEGGIVLRSTATLGGLVAAHTMLETARDALFLGRLAPEALTLVYAALAGLALVSAQANTAFVQRFGRRNALVFTLLGAAYGTVVIYLLPPGPSVVFGLYMWSALIGSVLVVQFWMLAGQLFTLAQGKRLFGLIAAGGVMGAVVGASLSALALRYVGVEHLLPTGAGVFLLTALVVTTVESDQLPPKYAARRKRKNVFGSIGRFRQYPYLTRLAILIGVSTATVLATDYLFKSTAARSLAPEALGPFFATYYAILNSVALLIQLLVAGPLVRRAGVLVAFCVLPALLSTGALALLIFGGSLYAVLMVKGADGALRHSMHRISSELLWMPLPEDVKANSKTFIDTVVVRGAQATIAGGLLVLASFELDRPEVLAGLVIAFAALWLVLAAGLRRPYLDLFRRALSRSSPEAVHGVLNLNIESIAVVVEALSSRDPDRAIAAIDLLDANHQQQVIPALILYHESPLVLIRALEVIAAPGPSPRKDWIPLAERLLEHRHPEVRVAALKALALAGDTDKLQPRVLDIDPSVRAQAAFWLARSEDVPPAEHPAIRQILDMDRHVASAAHASLLSAIATAGDRRWTPVILELCEDESQTAEVLNALAAAIKKVGDERFIPVLLRRLKYRTGRETVCAAIVELEEPALNALEKALRDPKTPRGIRRHIPRTISQFNQQRAADILLKRLAVERSGLIRFKILRSLERMVLETAVKVERRSVENALHRTLVEYLRLLSLYVPIEAALPSASEPSVKSGKLLVGLLGDKLFQALDRSFRLLHLVNRSEDFRNVAVAVQSSDRQLRAQALEYLDALTLNATVPEIRTLFRLIVDDLPAAERVARSSAFLPDPPQGYHEALSRLLRDPDDALASIAAYHALMLRQEGLTSDVISLGRERPTLGDLERIVDHLAQSNEVPSVA